ncbi:MAG: response regulator [Nitrospinota bacterium]
MANNLLLVDESPLIHRIVELTMEGYDISVYSAEDTEEALTLARSLKPDFILASTTFKRNSGFDLCRTLREDPELKDIPILLLASAKEEVSHEEAVEAGVIGVLTKPFKPESLLAEVGKALAWEVDAPGGETVIPGTPGEEPSLAENAEDELEEVDIPLPEVEGEPGSGTGEFNDDAAIAELSADEDDSAPPPEIEELDEIFADNSLVVPGPPALEEDAPAAPAGEVAPSADADPLKDLDDDDIFDGFDMDTGAEPAGAPTTEDTAPISEELVTEPSPAAEAEDPPLTAAAEIDSTMMAVEDALADEFEATADEGPAIDEAALEDLFPPFSGEEIDPTLLAAENELAEEFDALAQEKISAGEDATRESEIEDEAELEAVEVELASIQAEIAADFEDTPDHDEDGLEHLADDQITAAEQDLAAIQDELAAEDLDQEENTPDAQAAPKAESDYGTTAIEAEQFLEEMEFRETGTVEEEPAGDAEGDTEAPAAEAGEVPEAAAGPESEAAEFADVAAPADVEGELTPEDEKFWEQFDLEEDPEHAPSSQSPEIFSVPHDHDNEPAEAAPVAQGSASESSPGPDAALEEELTAPLAAGVIPETADAPSSTQPAPGAVEGMDIVNESIQKSLEQTVEAIVPALLRRIESLVVEQLPDMVEKIVLREIEKIKRGE